LYARLNQIVDSALDGLPFTINKLTFIGAKTRGVKAPHPLPDGRVFDPHFPKGEHTTERGDW